jgi:hypothetical protein
MEEGGPVPESKIVQLNNSGYGEVSWQASPKADWLTASPQSGITPASINIFINTDTLEYGEHYGEIALIDLDHTDSSQAITVILDVSAPLINISPDTMYFKVLAELGNPPTQSFQIDNIGSGQLSWTVEESADWFSISPSSGTAPGFADVMVDISAVEYGQYLEPLIVSSSEAKNSPETVRVALELVGNMPYLRATPDSIGLEGGMGDNLEAEVEISNPGSGILEWAAVTSVDWLLLDKYSGTDYDTLTVSVDNSLLHTGHFSTELLIYDSASFNQLLTIPVTLSLTSNDTIWFYNANTMPGEMAIMPVYIKLSEPAKAIYIPLAWDNSTAVLDSIVPQSGLLPPFVDCFTAIDADGTAEMGFRINEVDFYDDEILSGNYHIASLYFTADVTECFNPVDTASSDTAEVYVLNSSLDKVLPAIVGGQLVIGNPTFIDDRSDTKYPKTLTLSQNYPNPFNSSTSIEFSLPYEADVALSVYNILGQTVYEFESRKYPAGKYRIIWDGTLRGSHRAPSGIYFYRLRAAGFTLVKKMVLLK